MVINMSGLFTSEGIAKEYQVPVEFNQISWNKKVYPVTSAEPVELKLVHNGDRKVTVFGRLSLHAEMPCDRCLEPVDVPFDLEIEREIDANATDEERIAQLDEQSYIDGYNLDVDRLVQDELMLNMPMKVLCREDCKGVCPKCGINLNHQTCNCDVTELDPRMAVIRDIFNNSNH